MQVQYSSVFIYLIHICIVLVTTVKGCVFLEGESMTHIDLQPVYIAVSNLILPGNTASESR